MAQQKVMANPEFAKGLEVLKEDPELKEMFSEIKTKGPEALAKYWDDTETMSKIAKKMAALKTTEGPPKAADGNKGKEVRDSLLINPPCGLLS